MVYGHVLIKITLLPNYEGENSEPLIILLFCQKSLNILVNTMQYQQKYKGGQKEV